MNPSPFESLCLNPSILRALSEEGYSEPTGIQRDAIPEVLAGRDLVATAQTGTGKTAAFALPILETLHNRRPNIRGSIRALILTPTRELAVQVEESFRTYGRHLPLRSTVVVGGLSIGAQVNALRRRPDILVATPGRLIDLMQQKAALLDQVEILVLDEGDRMLDMGFIDDVRRIVKATPSTRQTLLFSATMSPEIARLAAEMLRSPVRVEKTPTASISGSIEQKVLFVDQANKGSLLTHILRGKEIRRVLVFTRTKHRANRIALQLSGQGISADAIHSNKSQNARQRALMAFDRGQITVLVATDIMARGIDVDRISHVINYEMPTEAANYVHRVGRTARAGALGSALSFCDAGEVAMLKEVEKLTRSALTAMEDHPFHSTSIASLRNARPIAKIAGAAPRPAERRSFGPWGRPRSRNSRAS